MAIKNVTLTPHQEAYVRANYNRMTTYEMADNLRICQAKVSENMGLMGLQRDLYNKNRSRRKNVPEGCFDVDALLPGATWVM